MIEEYLIDPSEIKDTLNSLIAEGRYKEAKAYYMDNVSYSMLHNVKDSSFETLGNAIKKGLK